MAIHSRKPDAPNRKQKAPQYIGPDVRDALTRHAVRIQCEAILFADFTLKMNGLPPNVNTMFWHRGKGKVKKPEAVEFEKLLWIRFVQSRPKEWKPNLIQVTIVLRSPRWLTKKGSITKIDADNRVKPLLDAIEKPLGIPDQVFVDTRVIKFPDSIESTEVYLRSVT